MIAVPIVTSIIGIGQTYLANLVGLRVMQDLRNSLYSHLQFMPLRFFTTTRTGEIQSRIANDVGGVQSVVTDTASNVLANIVMIISTLVAMFVALGAAHPAVARAAAALPLAHGEGRAGRAARSPRAPRRPSPTSRRSPRRRSA